MTEEDWLFLFTSLVSPRPIAWVSTLSTSGIPNLAPYSSYTTVADEPPVIFLGVQRRQSGERKHTAANILATRECVINVVDTKCVERMALTAADIDSNEFELAGVRAACSTAIASPRVDGAAASFECRLLEHHVAGRATDCFYLAVASVWLGDTLLTSLTPEVVRIVRDIATVGACGLEQYMTTEGMMIVRNPT